MTVGYRLFLQRTVEYRLFVLYGNSQSGKTTSALSLDERFPKDPSTATKQAKPRVLETLAYIQFDNDGLRQWGPLGYVPHRYVFQDFVDSTRQNSDQPDYFAAIDSLLETLDRDVPKLGIKYTITDTFTKLGNILETFYKRAARQQGVGNVQAAVYGPLASALCLYLELIQELPCSHVFNCHVKPLDAGFGSKSELERDRRMREQKVKAKQTFGAIMAPSVPGKTSDVLYQACTMEIFCEATRGAASAGKLGTRSFALYPNGSLDGIYRGKNGYGLIIGDKEPNLREIVRKIEAAEEGASLGKGKK